jgi:hypothetical protein
MNLNFSTSHVVRIARRRRFLFPAASVLLLLSTAVTAHAATITFNNLAPSPQYYYNFGNWTGNFLPNTYAISAMNFTPSATGTLDTLDLGLTNQKIVGSSVTTLRLSPEVSGMPSAPIWQANATAATIFGQLTSLTGIGGPTLTAGQTYWLEAFPPMDGVTLDGWYTNNQGDIGSIIGSGNFVPNTGRFALRVGVLQAPEPSALALAVFGLISICIFATRGRRHIVEMIEFKAA